MVAFGRFSLSPVAAAKQRVNYTTLDYEILPTRSLIIQEALLGMKEEHLHKANKDMTKTSLD